MIMVYVFPNIKWWPMLLMQIIHWSDCLACMKIEKCIQQLELVRMTQITEQLQNLYPLTVNAAKEVLWYLATWSSTITKPACHSPLHHSKPGLA